MSLTLDIEVLDIANLHVMRNFFIVGVINEMLRWFSGIIG